jgi:tryptophan halogenase
MQVLIGQGIVPATSHALAEAVPAEDLGNWLETLHALQPRSGGLPCPRRFYRAPLRCACPQGLVA